MGGVAGGPRTMRWHEALLSQHPAHGKTAKRRVVQGAAEPRLT